MTNYVENQIRGLLASGSPYLEASRMRGLQLANERRLLNSSMAAGAAELAAIESAYPIAAADAGFQQEKQLEALRKQTQASLYSTQGRISSELQREQAKIAAEAMREQNKQALLLAENQATHEKELAETRAAHEAGLEAERQQSELEETQLKIDAQTRVEEMNIASSEKTNLAHSVADLGKSFTQEITNIQRDPNVSAENKDVAIKATQDAYQANIDTLASIYGVEIFWDPVIPDWQQKQIEDAKTEDAKGDAGADNASYDDYYDDYYD